MLLLARLAMAHRKDHGGHGKEPGIATAPSPSSSSLGQDQGLHGKETQGRLWVVAAPIGNTGDLSVRAWAVLASADVVLAEDTRSARRLLAQGGQHGTGTSRPANQLILSCFDANESARAEDAVRRIAAGQNVALLSEAGTPLVSDPGFRVVSTVIAAGLRIQPIPGPSALLAALVGSGLSPDHFTFLGFPPRKGGPRRRLFETVRQHPFTLVLYESPLRTGETLRDLATVLGPHRTACVARELTKTHEEFVRGTLGELSDRYQNDRPLGEITLVVSGADEPSTSASDAHSDDTLAERAAQLLASGRSARDTADALAAESGRPRRQVYALVTAVASGTRGTTG